MQRFPVHTSLLSREISCGEDDKFAMWTKINDLTEEQKNDAGRNQRAQ